MRKIIQVSCFKCGEPRQTYRYWQAKPVCDKCYDDEHYMKYVAPMIMYIKNLSTQ